MPASRLSAQDQVRIDGMRELRRSLKGVSAEAPKELYRELHAIANEVIQQVRPLVPSKSGAARRSYKSRARASGAAIAMGGSTAEYTPFLDFGGSTGRGHVPGRGNSGAIKRPFLKRGRYLYPTLDREQDRIGQRVDDLIQRTAERYGFDTRGTG